MDWADLFAALALVFVIEGTMLFAGPRIVRRAYAMIAQAPERQLRVMGLVGMLAGLALLYLVRG